MDVHPGEITLTSNPETATFRGILKDTKCVWLRGYAVYGAPMGAGIPLFPQLVLLLDGAKVRHINRQTTNTQSRGHPLTLTGANTYQEYQSPRYIGHIQTGGEELRTLEVQIQRTADGPIVTKTPRATLPSAAEIEARYDHTRHVNPLLDKE